MDTIIDVPVRERDVTPAEGPRAESRWGMSAVRFVPVSVEDDRATPELRWHLADFMPSFDPSGFADVFRQIGDLTSGDETDEYGVLRPSDHALRSTIEVLIGTLIARKAGTFPRGCVTTDEHGGLRIEWSDDDRAVHLVVPAAHGGRSYIYHELGDSYGTEKRVSGSVLAHWLQRLFN